MVTFSEKEVQFLQSQEAARLATVSHAGWPQVTPIIYAFSGGVFYFAIDFKTIKERNIKANPKVSMAIDVYARQPEAVIIQGNAELFLEGNEFKEGYDLLVKRLDYFKANPFEEKEAYIVKVTPTTKTSWGIHQPLVDPTGSESKKTK